jgi:predicted RNA-binding protein
MCLAKAYVRPVNGCSGHVTQPPGTNGSILVMENVVHVDIDGDELRLRSLFGETHSLHGRVASIDFSEGKLILQCVEALQKVEA